MTTGKVFTHTKPTRATRVNNTSVTSNSEQALGDQDAKGKVFTHTPVQADIVDNTSNGELERNIYEDKTIYLGGEVPHVVHNKKQFKHKVRDPILGTFDENHTYAHEKSDIVSSKPVEKPVHDTYKPVSVDGPKTLEALKQLFQDDPIAIIDDILSKKTNFEQYPIDAVIPNISFLEGDEGVAHETEHHEFTVQSPNPKALIYLIDTVLTISQNMGYNKNKISMMIVQMFKMSKSLNEWISLLRNLWAELRKQKKI